MTAIQHNLLVDPLITVKTTDGHVDTYSLPGTYVLAAADAISDFPALRAHQAPAFHMFLVQIAVLASLETSGALPTSEDEWRTALRSLTSAFAEDEPWSLVVEDWTKPALLQPPLPTRDARIDYRRRTANPDALDILVTSKNHDLKAKRIGRAEAEDWLHALVTLQTMEGFLGKGNYGIARMNSGFASRPMLRLSPSGLGPGGQWLRDVCALLVSDGWRTLADNLGVGVRKPVAQLLWTLPWNGERSLALENFHPLAVEVCRRLRLVTRGDGRIEAATAGSKAARVDVGTTQGIVGDPWIPIDLRDAKKGPKAFTPTGEGFGYRRLTALLDAAQFRPALLQLPTEEERRQHCSFVLTAAALVRGKGKTEGFHERRIVWGIRASQLLASGEAKLVKRAQEFVEAAATAAGKALRPAIIQLADGKAEPDWKKPGNDVLTRPWLAGFDAAIDRHFFEELNISFETNEQDEAAAARWVRVLARLAREHFERAARALPRKEEGRYFGEARARNLLESTLKKHFPSLRKHHEALETTDDEIR